MRHLHYSSITLFFILLFACFHVAGAETPVQPVTNPTTTDSNLLSTETTTPQVPKPVVKAKKPKFFGPQVDPCATIKVDGDTWLDQVHALVQDNTCEPAVWFDNFFGGDHVLLDLRPGTFIKLRNTILWTEWRTVAYNLDFDIDWELPKWEKLLRRSRLYIESLSDTDKFTTQPGQPVRPGVNPATRVRKPVVGVQADLSTRLRAQIRIDTGVKINIHPNAFIRMRYQDLIPFGEVYLLRFSDIVKWEAVEHFSNTSQLDLERKLNTFSLVRWGNNVTYIEDTSGVSWNTGISLFTQLKPKSAISYDTSMWGVNYPEWTIQDYRVGSHYRRNFYRPWLFFEFTPEVTWPKDENGHRKSTYAFMTTLEIQFGR